MKCPKMPLAKDCRKAASLMIHTSLFYFLDSFPSSCGTRVISSVFLTIESCPLHTRVLSIKQHSLGISCLKSRKDTAVRTPLILLSLSDNSNLFCYIMSLCRTRLSCGYKDSENQSRVSSHCICCCSYQLWCS